MSELKPAGFWIRAGAYTIDGVVTALPQWIVLALLGGSAGLGPVLASSLFGMLVSAAYFTWMTAAFGGRTAGKMAAGVAVVSEDGSPVGYGQAFGRWFAYFLSILPCGFGFVVAGFTERKQALHDYAAGTRVVWTGPVPGWRKALVVAAPLLLAAGTLAATVLTGLKDLDFNKLGASAKAAMEEGRTFGEGTDQTGCLAEVVGRLDDCGLLCQVKQRIFLKVCLGAAEPSEGFCEGVPEPSSILASVSWTIGTCDKLGRPNQACPRVLKAVQEHCRPKAEI